VARESEEIRIQTVSILDGKPLHLDRLAERLRAAIERHEAGESPDLCSCSFFRGSATLLGEVMWLLRRPVPDHKRIAEFRRMHSKAVTQAGAELIRCARSLGLVRDERVSSLFPNTAAPTDQHRATRRQSHRTCSLHWRSHSPADNRPHPGSLYHDDRSSQSGCLSASFV